MTTDTVTARTDALIAQVERSSAHNYHPLPVVVRSAEGAWVTDVEGRRYLDCLAAYSALNFGHGHPQIVEAVVEERFVVEDQGRDRPA
jgi:ornithine--oxo-acid transaminase